MSSIGKDTDKKDRWKRKNTTQITQGKLLKKVLQISLSKSTARVLMEMDIWPVKEHLQYSAMILNHSIINIEGEQIAEKIFEEQVKYNIKQTFYS